ncbi:MAG: ketoacyl-ACP synthase III [Spirochaetaceae bacterium]|nr:MAG: ketoacyl-ACP synthase III [Spirochaetaceae bacterium]
MKAAITSLACHVPERIVTNDELAQKVETSDEWIYSHTGIRERRYAAPGESASDLGVIAGRRALEQAHADPDSIDLVICATSTPDYLTFPATACVIQDRLGLSNAGAFDLQAGCTGFAYGVEMARSLVEAGGAGRVLLIGTEVLTSITNWEDRATCILFGDGAGAVLVEASDADRARTGHTIVASWLRSKGSGGPALIRQAGGSREPFEDGRHAARDLLLAMNGKQVYLFAVDAIVQTITALSERVGKTPDDVDWIVPHQANSRIIEAAAKRLRLPVERFYLNVDRYANTSAASIPIALEEMVSTGALKSGQTVLTVGFGAGLTYGGNVLDW